MELFIWGYETVSALVTASSPKAWSGTCELVPKTKEDSSQIRAFRKFSTSRGARVGPGVSCKIAVHRDELHAAFELVYQAYTKTGLARPNRFRLRVTPYHLLPTTEIYLAVEQGEVISTVSLVRDGELGLPMEAVYPEEVAIRRMRGRRLGEVSCLADNQHSRGQRLRVVLHLMSFMSQCAERRGIDELMIAVHPRHAKFYHQFAAFDLIGDERSYGTVCGNPAVAMSLDLDRAPVDHPRSYELFFGSPFPPEDLAYRALSEELQAELRLIVNETKSRGKVAESVVLAGV